MAKYKYLFVLQGYYGTRWDDLTLSDTHREACRDLRDYNIHESNIPHRIIKRRVLSTGGQY